MNAYEDLGRFEDAARVCSDPVCFGVKADANQLIEAYRTGGPEAYWRKRLEVLDSAPDRSGLRDFGYAVIYARLGEADKAIDHLERMVDHEGWRRCVHRGGSVCQTVQRPPAIQAADGAGGDAHGFSTAYSADMIGA